MNTESLININADTVPTLDIIFTLTILMLLPSLVVMMTSFVRIIIILSFTRTAIGTPQTPPNMVLTGMALILTLFVMSPVLKEVNETVLIPYNAQEITSEEAMEQIVVPFKTFMLKNTEKSSLNLFVNMAKIEVPEDTQELPITVVIASFMTSELKRGFTAGLLLYLPFLLIDIVVSSTLMSMGMIMLPPATIAMPFKLLLFVSVNGWGLLFKTVVEGFQ